MHNQEYLNYYFSKIWKPGTNRGISSPEQLIEQIDPIEWLLDVGCGKNPFKKLHARTVGIDPAFDESDYKCTIEDFEPTRLFDVATCLGSINFGSEEIISNQIEKVVSCLKPVSRIYWRLNPGQQDHSNEECANVVFFPWTFEKLNQFARMYNYTQTFETIENSSRVRMFAIWEKGK